MVISTSCQNKSNWKADKIESEKLFWGKKTFLDLIDTFKEKMTDPDRNPISQDAQLSGVDEEVDDEETAESEVLTWLFLKSTYYVIECFIVSNKLVRS